MADDDKARRLAAALRANLHRRKAQAREQGAAEADARDAAAQRTLTNEPKS